MQKRSLKQNESDFRSLAAAKRPLTARAVADLCGVELKTVHNWALEGRLDHFRTPGRHLRFPPTAVVAFLEACGFELPLGNQRSVILVKGPASRALQRVLGPFDVSVARDVPSALIVCARVKPTALVVDLGLVHAFPKELLEQCLRAVRRELPAVQIVCVSSQSQARALVSLRRVRGLVWSTPETLLEVLG